MSGQALHECPQTVILKFESRESWAVGLWQQTAAATGRVLVFGTVQVVVLPDFDATLQQLAGRLRPAVVERRLGCEVFHRDGGRLVPGPDPERRSYLSYASFSDPDGNGWLLQEVTARLPGREWGTNKPTSLPKPSNARLRQVLLTVVHRSLMKPVAVGFIGCP